MDLKKELKTLRLENRELNDLTIRDVIVSYRKIAKEVHPDRNGLENKAEKTAALPLYTEILNWPQFCLLVIFRDGVIKNEGCFLQQRKYKANLELVMPLCLPDSWELFTPLGII